MVQIVCLLVFLEMFPLSTLLGRPVHQQAGAYTYADTGEDR